MAATFAEWLGQQMDRRGIRSGRRLAMETGIEEQQILDWAVGRRVPQWQDVERLARHFGVPSGEAQTLRHRTEQQLVAARAKR